MSDPAQSAVSASDTALVAEQIGRAPRVPWRVAARCRFGQPSVIVSPSRLADGTPFPTYAWLTCPHLTERVGAVESTGAAARFTELVRTEPAIELALRAMDARVRELRTAESGGVDACPTVGLGGQRNPLGVKCLHLHVALALLGERDPIGEDVLAGMDRECEDNRCAALSGAAPEEDQ